MYVLLPFFFKRCQFGFPHFIKAFLTLVCNNSKIDNYSAFCLQLPPQVDDWCHYLFFFYIFVDFIILIIFFQQAYCLCFIYLSKLPNTALLVTQTMLSHNIKVDFGLPVFLISNHLIYEHFNLSRSKFKDLPQRSVRLSIVLIAIYLEGHIFIYFFILVAVIVNIANKIISST